MFECRACKELRAENERLHALIARLLDKVAGPVISQEEEPVQPPPLEVERDQEGNILVERFNYGV